MPVANAFGYTSERLWRRMGWVGLIRLALAVSLCAAIGFAAGRLAGFPLYPGWQGVFVQQPWNTAGWGFISALVAMLLGLAVALIIAPPVEMRMPAVVAATTLLGFTIRGGTMGSVMQAAGGREIFWLLAAELVVLTVLLAFLVTVWRAMRSPESRAPGAGAGGSAGLGSGVVQIVVTAGLLWVLGRSYAKPQALMSVLLAGGIGVWAGHLATGQVWRWAWLVPMMVGIAGYAANGVWAAGVETAGVSGATLGFAIALPLDYAAVGALGVVLGTIATRGEGEDAAPSTREQPKADKQE